MAVISRSGAYTHARSCAQAALREGVCVCDSLAVTGTFPLAHLFVRLLLRQDTLHGIGASARPQPLDLLEARYRMLHGMSQFALYAAALVGSVGAVGRVLEYAQ